MPPSDARARLSAAQDAIVSALLAGGAIPAGFDPESVARARRTLEEKRAWVQARRERRGRRRSRLRWLLALALGRART